MSERAVGDDDAIVGSRERDQVSKRLPADEVEEDLVGEDRHPQCLLGTLPPAQRVVADAQVTGDTGSLHPAHSFHAEADREGGVGPVHLIEIYLFDSQTAPTLPSASLDPTRERNDGQELGGDEGTTPGESPPQNLL